MVTLVLVCSTGARSGKPLAPEELTNFLLSPEYAQWLVGPLSLLATDAERAEFLNLTDDEAAAAFIERFWEARGPNIRWPPQGSRYTYEERAVEADKRFSEGSVLGRRTDRGTIFVLYGEPLEIAFDFSAQRQGPGVEVWVYGKGFEPGLDGQRPNSRYYFQELGGVTRQTSLRARRRLPNGP